MDSKGIRKRPAKLPAKPKSAFSEQNGGEEDDAVQHIGPLRYLRLTLLLAYFFGSCICIHFQQYLGLPLYLYNQDWYYAWQALAKQYFGILLITLNNWWCPTSVRVSGDKSVRGEIRRTAAGGAELHFPERIVLMANHQIYTDWIFLWWSAYTAQMHGHFFIILKESLQYIPLLGPGMMFFSFLFLSRKWETDMPRMQHRLSKLKSKHHGPLSGTSDLDPMWLLLFPEGTNISKNGRAGSKKWADKIGVEDLKHTLLPRSRGLLFCLTELKGTVDWLYDCTISYDGIPDGMYGQDIFTLRNTYIAGRRSPSVNIHWRKFAISSIPLDDPQAFDAWLNARWAEKDALIEFYARTGRFPADDGEDEPAANGTLPEGGKPAQGIGHIETEVRLNHPLEFLQIFVSALAVPLVWKPLKWGWWAFKLLLLIVSFGQVRM